MPGVLQRLGAVDAHVADRGAALEVGVLGDQPRALEDLLEVALGEPLALGDHAEAVGAGGLGGLGVLEDLVGLHHRVHRRLGLGEARLGAEAAVLGAAAGLRVDQRAHVGAVAELLLPRVPGAVDEREDLVVVLDLAEADGFFAGDERRHARHSRHGSGRDAEFPSPAWGTDLPPDLAKWTGRSRVDHQKWGWQMSLTNR